MKRLRYVNEHGPSPARNKTRKTTLRICPTLLTSIKIILHTFWQNKNSVMFVCSGKDSTVRRLT